MLLTIRINGNAHRGSGDVPLLSLLRDMPGDRDDGMTLRGAGRMRSLQRRAAQTDADRHRRTEAVGANDRAIRLARGRKTKLTGI